MTFRDQIAFTRRFVREVPLTAEQTTTDTSIVGSPTVEFSDVDLGRRIMDAVRDIASLCKAMHMPALISEATTPEDVESSIRLLTRRVFYSPDGSVGSDVRAYRVTEESVRRSRTLGSRSHPVYTYEGGRFKMYPDADNMTAYVLTLGGLTAPETDADLDTTLPLPITFRVALACHVASTVLYNKGQMEFSDLYDQMFGGEIRPYHRSARYSTANDSEMSIEP